MIILTHTMYCCINIAVLLTTVSVLQGHIIYGKITYTVKMEKSWWRQILLLSKTLNQASSNLVLNFFFFEKKIS